jgi:cytochrome o ubiquinol oxidase subunit 1
MGAGANVNAFFGVATMIIAVPTGVKVFNWLFTMFRGRIHFTTPMLWTMGFFTTFAIGGMTGVLMSVPPVDFQLHNSLFLVAHFHNVIIGGVVFGYFAGFIYWFPKLFGFKLHEGLGRCAFWCWLVGFYVAFMPLYVLGLKGMTRRLNHYSAASGWHPYLIVAAVGTLIIGVGFLFQVTQLIYSIKHREKLRVGNDPWDGRTLEWSIPSPAPYYNFAVTPEVSELDDFWAQKEKGLSTKKPNYVDVHMPKDTSTGFVIAIFAGLFGFGIIWHITWMILFGLAGVFFTVAKRTFNMHTDYYIKAADIEKMDAKLSSAGQ